jgi:pimeloyl-ACP methyl ester carboxylesterase
MSKTSVANPVSPPEEDGLSSAITLPDGRKLGYAQYGSPTGRSIILNHGMACSRHDGAWFHEVGLEVGARIICVDRPGMGLSTAHPSRTVLTFAKDVEQLTEHLNLEAYSVMVRITFAQGSTDY